MSYHKTALQTSHNPVPLLSGHSDRWIWGDSFPNSPSLSSALHSWQYLCRVRCRCSEEVLGRVVYLWNSPEAWTIHRTLQDPRKGWWLDISTKKIIWDSNAGQKIKWKYKQERIYYTLGWIDRKATAEFSVLLLLHLSWRSSDATRLIQWLCPSCPWRLTVATFLWRSYWSTGLLDHEKSFLFPRP